MLFFWLAFGLAAQGAEPTTETREIVETEGRWLPVFEDPILPFSPSEEMMKGDASPSKIEEIRVQIFPHVGRYTAPMGLDSVVRSVTLQTGRGVCRSYEGPASIPLRRADFSPSQSLNEGAQLDLDIDTVQGPLWIECDGSAELVRAGRKPTRYAGGSFYVEKFMDGTALRVVQILPFEDYLKGVVPSEMPTDWDGEALKAQAVAARTYAISQTKNSRKQGKAIDVDDTVFYQAYTGSANRTARSDTAVDETEGEIIYFGNRVITAFFSADSGGYTEDASNVWPMSTEETKYCKAKPEVFENKKVSWSKTLTLAEIRIALIKAGLMKAAKKLESFSIKSLLPSGRAETILLRFNDDSQSEITGVRFQNALRLKSAMFQMTQLSEKSNSFEFDGFGWGHGVGMSQQGAQELASIYHWGYKSILHFYFTDVTIASQ